MLSTTKIDMFFILPLLFAIFLAKRHIETNKNYRLFIVSSVVTISLMLLDIASIAISASASPIAVGFNKALNSMGFAASPLVPFLMYFFIVTRMPKRRTVLLLAIPLAVNMVIGLSSFSTGWSFSVSMDNVYTRGPAFFLTPASSLFYFFLDIDASLHLDIRYQKEDILYLAMLYGVPVVAVILQTIYPDVLVIWGSVSLTLVMYYVLILSKHFTFDTLTKLKNRESFELAMQELRSRERKDASLFVFDLNNLKQTNDSQGHSAGDRLLAQIAQLLDCCFEGEGTPYRIGGDEFCVIANPVSDSKASMLLSNLHARVALLAEKDLDAPLGLAYGYATSDKANGIGIDETFSKADNAMYENKARNKKEAKEDR
jgi:diguanylate cyclase (GGDEF)-like protein